MIVLFERQQLMGEYVLFQNELDNSSYCYDPPFSPQNIIMWTPDTTWLSFVNQPESYKSLDEVSNYDIHSISEQLKIPDQPFCIQIQVTP